MECNIYVFMFILFFKWLTIFFWYINFVFNDKVWNKRDLLILLKFYKVDEKLENNDSRNKVSVYIFSICLDF